MVKLVRELKYVNFIGKIAGRSTYQTSPAGEEFYREICPEDDRPVDVHGNPADDQSTP
jgi:hypothetical protein